ncbi:MULTISPECIES: DMT family transporter [Thermoactinomyces]|jgi:drug/metabolite transporter (DMT)-like permease|uniref:EamA family transporter n=1 Tax=Thermoactinomyces daqus TaxID=1329516 RepID=A0A7W1XBU6_9BACL|nr:MULTISPECIES: DMT family transporter [Thermoactinomyces]MBA4543782.1 EamA family transporter [Thermoactinomyces daqus]MBH8598405.1 EamA family transporter [Thermoactinomyces sp. CICC 10523]MBH8604530.1 EamA family transporter [Thermoactinomyces sp. CICC 10522]MBH8607467.1 EamA family transporter [Thermoactinomyces sp. CICC 10521]
MNWRNLSLLFSLAALWGASFLFMRIAAPVIGPIFLVALRLGFAFLALFLYGLVIKKGLGFIGSWKKYIALGAVNAAIPFVLISFSEVYLPASFAAILNATTPLFSAVIARIWIKEPLNARKILGLITGFIGVIVLVGWTTIQLHWQTVVAIVSSLMAACFYGIGSIYAKKNFNATPLELSIGQMFGSAVAILPFACFTIPGQIPSMAVIWSVLGLALLSTAFAYLLYFRLLKEVGPTQTLYVTFLVPIFGCIWGAIFLRERIGLATCFGLCLIIFSILLLTNLPLGRKKKVQA